MTKRFRLTPFSLPLALFIALLFSQNIFAQSNYTPSLEGHILTFEKKDAKGVVVGYSKSTYNYRKGGEKDYTISISIQEYDIQMNPSSDPFIFETEYIDGSPKDENLADFIKKVILEGIKSSTEKMDKESEDDINDLNIDVTMDGKPFLIPEDAKVGAQFVGYTVKIKIAGINVGSVGVSNITVTDKQELSLADKSISCTVVQSTMTTKVMLKKIVNINKEWHSAKYGVVKSQTLNKKGVIQSTSELISIEKLPR